MNHDPDDVTLRTTDPEQVMSMLLCVDFEEITKEAEAAIHSWTDDQRAEAFEWAMREHLNASDNDDVKRFTCPDYVKAIRPPVGPRGW